MRGKREGIGMEHCGGDDGVSLVNLIDLRGKKKQAFSYLICVTAQVGYHWCSVLKVLQHSNICFIVVVVSVVITVVYSSSANCLS